MAATAAVAATMDESKDEEASPPPPPPPPPITWTDWVKIVNGIVTHDTVVCGDFYKRNDSVLHWFTKRCRDPKAALAAVTVLSRNSLSIKWKDGPITSKSPCVITGTRKGSGFLRNVSLVCQESGAMECIEVTIGMFDERILAYLVAVVTIGNIHSFVTASHQLNGLKIDEQQMMAICNKYNDSCKLLMFI